MLFRPNSLFKQLTIVSICLLSSAFAQAQETSQLPSDTAVAVESMPISGGVLLEGPSVAADYCDASDPTCCFNTKTSCACTEGPKSSCCSSHPFYRGCSEDPFRKACEALLTQPDADFGEMARECCQSVGYDDACKQVIRVLDFPVDGASAATVDAKKDTQQPVQ